ncbi:glycosyltransferase family 2 protein [Flavobacterium sp. F372]|uniref:Glycosyltransferase family 2 protein n=1 Tax=Flavobacterium bernardetii TaxID=2813823 RepID=A0ABR7IY65_9FLAO|nr:glycosyltransferase family 2 protein [Flavobacterium bernardetii]MBC5834726.1 glycosyltransferase family 2 protein [Flavobacterium bernardetii]NHF70374.1 glycosyltransferase family 2 protein [Flavobacterium bernardetii]
MQLSVIILNYNVRYFLEQCVLSVQKALIHLDAEIIVVDNNSSDDSCAMMKRLFPHIKLIENKENVGFPKGNNIAVAEAKGEYVCILNPDTVVAEDTFEKILSFCHSELVSESNLGIIGCKLIDGTGNFLPESKRGVPTPWVAFTKIFGLYKVSNYFGKYYAQHLTENQSGKVDILVGAFMVLKRDLYLQVGGFDENCFMYSDDIDLSYMIQKLGKENFYFHETSVIHYKGESTVRDEKYLKRFREAMQFFYKKHFKKSVIFDVMMQIGSFVFTIFKQKQQKNTVRIIDKYIVFSKENLQLNLNKSQEYLTDFKQFVIEENLNIEVVFDRNSFSFAEIISFMEKNKSKKITFKNYISQSNYLIGSNNANDRGEVINF